MKFRIVSRSVRNIVVVVITTVCLSPFVLAGITKAAYATNNYQVAHMSAQVQTLISWYDRPVGQFAQATSLYKLGKYDQASILFRLVQSTAEGDLKCKASYNGALSSMRIADNAREQDKGTARNAYQEALQQLLNYCQDNQTYKAQYDAAEAYIRQQLDELKTSNEQQQSNNQGDDQTQDQKADTTDRSGSDQQQQVKNQLDRNKEAGSGAGGSAEAVEQNW